MSETPKQDSRSVSELFSAATDLTLDDGWEAWLAVSALQGIGTREVLDRALELVASDNPRLRWRAVDILGQLGSPNHTFPDECLNAALRVLNSDPDPRVLASAAIALRHLKDPRGIDALVRRRPRPRIGSDRHATASPPNLALTADGGLSTQKDVRDAI